MTVRRVPIAPGSMQHQRERLALGALRPFEDIVVRVDDGREPAVGREVRCTCEWGGR